MKSKFGFIVIRHVNSAATNELWIEACNCIRKYYKNPILIVDDNSNPEHVSENTFADCTIINSEFPKRGEILAYYYFWKTKPFDKAIIIHDSVFIQKYIDFSLLPEITYLWKFIHTWDNQELEIRMINTLQTSEKNKETLLQLYEKKEEWNGCFGAMSVVNYKFLNDIEIKYNFLKSYIPYINHRDKRMTFERIYGLICMAHLKTSNINTENNKTLFGDIHNFIQKNYETCGCIGWSGFFLPHYKKYNYNMHTPIIKVWSAR